MAAIDKLKQALAAQETGRQAEAEKIYREILRDDPRNADALHYLSISAYLKQNHQEALALVDQAVALAPTYGPALNTRGNILIALGQPAKALESYKQALAVKPQSVSVLNNLGNAYLELNRPDEALIVLDRALMFAPNHRDALFNRGNAKLKAGRRAEAIADYDRSIALDPSQQKAFLNRGIAFQELGHIDDALKNYREVLRLDPDHADSHYNIALCHLANGDMEKGFAAYEWRWRVEPQKHARWRSSPRRWLGQQDLSGKTLLIHSEQGYGDTIQFARLVPEAAKRAARILFEVQPPLKTLLAGLESVAEIISQGDPLPPYDYDCPLLSLPLALNISLDTIPPPLLLADPERVAIWQRLLPDKRGLRVGLAWSGRPDHPNDRHRSIAAHRFAPLQMQGVTLVSLQKEYRDEDRAWLSHHGVFHDYADQLTDFADTAALTSLMDVVVSVDTSVAHLAGALCKPVWILLPSIATDWRWLRDREDSPWYPTARLFRQSAMDDWDPVISRVCEHLRSMCRDF